MAIQEFPISDAFDLDPWGLQVAVITCIWTIALSPDGDGTSSTVCELARTRSYSTVVMMAGGEDEALLAGSSEGDVCDGERNLPLCTRIHRILGIIKAWSFLVIFRKLKLARPGFSKRKEKKNPKICIYLFGCIPVLSHIDRYKLLTI